MNHTTETVATVNTKFAAADATVRALARVARATMLDEPGARWHRLAIQADELPQLARDDGVALGERDPLGANPATLTPDVPLRVDQRHPCSAQGRS